MRDYVVLLTGVLIASSAAILIRFAQADGLPSLTIAAGRLSLAALVLTPAALRGGKYAAEAWRARFVAAAAAAGVFLAVHFAAWITSLEHTSVASSVALVATNPVWVALVSHFVMRERVGAAGVASIALTVGGSVVLGLSGWIGETGAFALSLETGSFGDALLQQTSLRGDALALLGAIAASAYLLIGRRSRSSGPLLRYIWVAYAGAALLLWLAVAVTGAPVTGFPLRAYIMVLALALGPQLLGHGAFNYAVRRLSATVVAVAIVGEPIGSAILAFFLLDERLVSVVVSVGGQLVAFPIQLFGLTVLVVGIVSATLDEQRRKRAAISDPLTPR